MFASLVKNRKICIIDSNPKIGAKIKVSGGGKCNITNKYLSSDNYLGDKEFIKAIFEKFDNDDLLEFLAKNGVNPTVQNKVAKGQYFCKSSNDVINMFERLATHTKFFLNRTVSDVEYKKHYIIQTSKGIIEAKKLVVASGGLSFSILRSSDIGHKIAQKFGHTINTLNPALVGFTVQKEQFWFKELSGLSLPVSIKANNKDCDGDILFAYKGCSGPAVLNASLYWQKGKMNCDFLPTLKLEKFLKGNKLISSALPVPKRFIKKFLESIGLDDKSVSRLTSQERQKLQQLKNYEFSPAGNFGYTKAEVTKGGVSLNEINSLNMESKLQKDLYFLGEVLDVTGELGGYNFQWAFSSAYVCAKFLLQNISTNL